MAITQLADGHFLGLSSDTKPVTNVVTGSRLTETNTGDVHIFDGTYWWLLHQGPFSPKRLGRLRFGASAAATAGGGALDALTNGTGTGTIAYVMDNTNGRYISFPTGTTTGNKSGQRIASAAYTQRAYFPKIRIRFQLTEITLTRVYLGFGDNSEPTGDTPFNNKNGFALALLSGGTNFILARNDGDATGGYATVIGAADTSVHEIKIVGHASAPSFSFSFDGGTYVDASVDCPTANTNIVPIFMNETNESGVAKTLKIYDVFFQSDK